MICNVALLYSWFWWLVIWCYSPLSWADSLHLYVILHLWLAFYSAFLEYPPKWCTYNTGIAGATWNCCHLSTSSAYSHVPCHFIQSHIRKVCACLAVTCHLHFWQNDRDLLRATAVTQGWNGYRNKSQHRNVDTVEENSPAAPAGIQTRDLSITSPAL